MATFEINACKNLAVQFMVSCSLVYDLWETESMLAPRSEVYDLVVDDLIRMQEGI